MAKRLQAIGDNSGLVIDRPLLELLEITSETELEVTVEGDRLIVTPIRPEVGRQRLLAAAQKRTLEAHAETFRKLAQ